MGGLILFFERTRPDASIKRRPPCLIFLFIINTMVLILVQGTRTYSSRNYYCCTDCTMVWDLFTMPGSNFILVTYEY